MRRSMLGVGILMIVAGLFLLAHGQLMRNPQAADGPFPGERVDNIDRQRFPEPSDIAYHPTRKTLFVVSDEGHLAEIKTDGTPVNKLMGKAWRDYEGVTVNPATALVYVGVEGEEAILEIDPDTLKAKRTFSIERTFKGEMVLKAGGNGIEGIAFVPNEKHAEGGTFLVCNQVMDPKRSPGEASAIFEVEVPLKTAKEGTPLVGKLIRRIDIAGAVDLSALCWDAARQRLYVLSDGLDTFYELTLDGQVLRRYSFPGRDQEGLAVDAEGFVYYTQDSGGIIKMKWLRDPEQDKEPAKAAEQSKNVDKVEEPAKAPVNPANPVNPAK